MKVADESAYYRDMSKELSPVATAVEPTRVASVERAKDFAKSLARSTLEAFAKDPTLAQYPSSTKFSGRAEYAIRKSQYDRVIMLTTSTPASPGKPYDAHARHADAAKVEAFIKVAGENADVQFTAFVMKLESKVGACKAAELSGDHVWGHSLLTVTKADGVVEVWKTQQIINVSKLGRPFNQWPTRKLGGRARKAG